jgi:hypothetical protein
MLYYIALIIEIKLSIRIVFDKSSNNPETLMGYFSCLLQARSRPYNLFKFANFIRFQTAILTLPAVICLFGYPTWRIKSATRRPSSAYFNTATICSVEKRILFIDVTHYKESSRDLLNLQLDHLHHAMSLAYHLSPIYPKGRLGKYDIRCVDLYNIGCILLADWRGNQSLGSGPIDFMT